MNCRLCLGESIYNGRVCICQSGGRKPYFPPKPKKKANDLLASGHKHDCHSVVSSHSTYEWWECSCGHVYKIAVR